MSSNPADPDIMYGANYGGSMDMLNRRTGKSTAVDPWPLDPMGHDAKDSKYRFQWTYPIVHSPHNPNTIYVGSSSSTSPESVSRPHRRLIRRPQRPVDAAVAVVVTNADLVEQTRFALQVRERITEANEGVITVRNLERDMNDRAPLMIANTSFASLVKTFADSLSAVEDSLYQTQNQIGDRTLEGRAAGTTRAAASADRAVAAAATTALNQKQGNRRKQQETDSRSKMRTVNRSS